VVRNLYPINDMTVADSTALQNSVRNLNRLQIRLRPILRNCKSDTGALQEARELLESLRVDIARMIEREKSRQCRRRARRMRLKKEGKEA